MDPVFTLQWPEYVVCERLQKLCPRSEGYSTYIPVSRQEKGVDLTLLHRSSGKRRAITIQVKASRTYMGAPPKAEDNGSLQLLHLVQPICAVARR
jgi:hypothetical protein